MFWQRVLIIIFSVNACLFFVSTAQRLDFRLDSAQLMTDLKILSSDSLMGRATGTEGNRKARAYIKARLQDIGVSSFVPEYEQSFMLHSAEKDSIKAVNLIGYVEGFSSKEAIVLSAHYDHIGAEDTLNIFNGADDNASGVAALLAIAEYFVNDQPENTFIFSFFDAEESGLIGAKHFTQSIVFDSSMVKMNVNLDMVARADNGVLYAVGTAFNPVLKELVIQSLPDGEVVVKFGRDIKGKKPYWVNASDHAPFHRLNIPFIYFGVDDHADYHKLSDEFSAIDPSVYINCVRLIVQSVINFDASLEMIAADR